MSEYSMWESARTELLQAIATQAEQSRTAPDPKTASEHALAARNLADALAAVAQANLPANSHRCSR